MVVNVVEDDVIVVDVIVAVEVVDVAIDVDVVVVIVGSCSSHNWSQLMLSVI